MMLRRYGVTFATHFLNGLKFLSVYVRIALQKVPMTGW